MADTERKFDELLDNALAEYSNAEPREGLEDRIVANLATAETEKRSWLRWWPALSLAATAAVVLVVFFAMQSSTTKPAQVAVAPPPITATTHAAEVEPTASISQPGSKPRLKLPPRTAPVLTPAAPTQLAVTKQAVFPAPTALSAQEKLLMAYVRRTPMEEIAANSKPDPLPEVEINQVLPGQKTQRSSDQNQNTR